MKNVSENDNTVITVSEETSSMVRAIANLDNIFNFASQKAEENNTHDSDNIERNYKNMRDALVKLLVQGISRNICIDATCI